MSRVEKNFCPTNKSKTSSILGIGNESFLVIAFSFLWSTQRRVSPDFFLTMAMGAAHGDKDELIIFSSVVLLLFFLQSPFVGENCDKPPSRSDHAPQCQLYVWLPLYNLARQFLTQICVGCYVAISWWFCPRLVYWTGLSRNRSCYYIESGAGCDCLVGAEVISKDILPSNWNFVSLIFVSESFIR
jgi:hypothetical protein